MSSGGISPLQRIPPAASYLVPFATSISRATGLPTFAVGLITEPKQAESIIQAGEADCGWTSSSIGYRQWREVGPLGERPRGVAQRLADGKNVDWLEPVTKEHYQCGELVMDSSVKMTRTSAVGR